MTFTHEYVLGPESEPSVPTTVYSKMSPAANRMSAARGVATYVFPAKPENTTVELILVCY